MVTRFAETIEDPEIREAVALQGYEEDRHARLIAVMLDRYAIPFTEPVLGEITPTQRAFTDFGYEECLDSFFGFGLYAIARRVRYFQDDFLSIFEGLLEEEARHITFFVNWIAHERARRGIHASLLGGFAGILDYGHALRRLKDTFAAGDMAQTGFGAAGADKIFEEMTPARFLEACLAENRRVMSRLDRRLLQPRLIPRLATAALGALRVVPAPLLERLGPGGKPAAGAAGSPGGERRETAGSR
jgi:hypothetical protein